VRPPLQRFDAPEEFDHDAFMSDIGLILKESRTTWVYAQLMQSRSNTAKAVELMPVVSSLVILLAAGLVATSACPRIPLLRTRMP